MATLHGQFNVNKSERPVTRFLGGHMGQIARRIDWAPIPEEMVRSKSQTWTEEKSVGHRFTRPTQIHALPANSNTFNRHRGSTAYMNSQSPRTC